MIDGAGVALRRPGTGSILPRRLVENALNPLQKTWHGSCIRVLRLPGRLAVTLREHFFRTVL